jgi:phage shock protein PspC (stress-responsive transcriptional regulator)
LNTCSLVALILVVTLTSTTFTFVVISYILTSWTYAIRPQISHETSPTS